ncbi:membrane-associated guanylate kinase, WW and PDZ domain-containing protein 1 [Lates japonicus]
MTHSQAVEQIRRGGHRIHLVLKRGNGYVPDYGREHRITSPSLLRHPKEQGLAAVDFTGRRGRSSRQKRRSRSSDGREKEKGTGRRRRGASEGGGRSRLQSPVSEQGERSREDRDRGRRKKGRRGEPQSLPRDALRNYDDSDTEGGRVRGRRRERERRSRSRGRKSRSEKRVRTVEGEEEPEEVQEVPAVEERVGMAEGEEKPEEEPEEAQEVPAIEERVEDRDEEVEERVNLERGESDENIILPIPSLKQKLPRPKQIWEEENDENWDMALEYRELRKEKELESEHEQEQEQERPWDDDRADDKETELNEDEKDDDALSGRIERLLPSAAVIDPMSHRKPFSFLTSTLSVEQLRDDESESGGSQSDGSVSAASISGLSLAAAEGGGRRAAVLPGPWLAPSRQRVAQVTEGNGRPGRQTGQGGGRSAVS